jgi:hypothetical protein
VHTILLLIAVTLVWNDGRLPSVRAAEQPAPVAADITLEVVNTLAAEGRALGLDDMGEGSFSGVNNVDMRIVGYSSTGAISFIVELDPANTSCFGAAFDPAETGTFYTNDWSGNDLYYTYNWGTSWRSVFDPSFKREGEWISTALTTG